MSIFLDANVVIYAVESHAILGAPAQTRIARAEVVGDTFRISDLVRMECLVLPIRLGKSTVETQFLAFFARSDVTVVGITSAVCDRAAHNFKSMDSLQIAAAVEHGADIFLTADARLASFTDLTVEVMT